MPFFPQDEQPPSLHFNLFSCRRPITVSKYILENMISQYNYIVLSSEENAQISKNYQAVGNRNVKYEIPRARKYLESKKMFDLTTVSHGMSKANFHDLNLFVKIVLIFLNIIFIFRKYMQKYLTMYIFMKINRTNLNLKRSAWKSLIIMCCKNI